MKEYKIIQNSNKTELENEINKLSVEGWEAVNISVLGIPAVELVVLLVSKKNAPAAGDIVENWKPFGNPA
jgi:hypothetical protein